MRQKKKEKLIFAFAALTGVVALAASITWVDASVSGLDDRIDASRPAGQPNILPRAELTLPEKARYDTSVGTIYCASTEEFGTATLVSKEHGFIFLTAAHLIVTDEMRRMRNYQNKKEFRKTLAKYAEGCQVILINDSGRPFKDKNGRDISRYDVDPLRIVVGGFLEELDSDWLAFAIRLNSDRGVVDDLELLESAEAVNLLSINVTPRDGVAGRIIGFHHDVFPKHVKIKSYGDVWPLSPARLLRQKSQTSLCHDIDTSGWASGSLILSKNNEAFAVHNGGNIKAGELADCSYSGNFAVPITPKMIESIHAL